ncbi:hypothetical protein C2E21_4548 [Chlorella sorokiniana]|uniref:Nucleotide-diphospho-sugar transferase domain-containing protein n=1 Tax=Chlorella sorokiniana TaxID=3076 RepID=A0A2P6TRR9_CHLSO|nr:hypothetical protein C2E21_4548 [Chlorella sorokiniana]|eukprot:PRW56763.1 hypothetical protein C2E21_4548 [Chlorella sorokiniana]
MHPSTPSKDMFERIQANPALAASAAAAEEFAAAPWLLPPRSPAFPYAGVHGLADLMALRSTPAGRYPRAVTILLFSKAYAIMAQNSIYSLVKHAGVRNYLAVSWSQADFEACLDLNLPCADVSDLLLEPLAASGAPTQHDFVTMTWIKPAVVLRALRLGYAIMAVDTDISYAVKPLWESYLALIEQNDADGAWQHEAPINSGHFVLLPTNASLAFAEAWAAAGPASIPLKVAEQKALPALEGSHFVACRSLCLCYRCKYELFAQGRRDRVAVFATYFPSHFSYSPVGCTVGSQAWVPHVDPCDWTVLYMHPICAWGAAAKEGILREAGFWFMDSERGCVAEPGAASSVPACRPLHWRQPDAEAAHYSCPSFGLGLVHGRLPLLRTLFARVGSDPYYASYDRSLGNIKSEVDRVQAARAARAKAWGAVRARFLGYWAASWAVLLAYAAYVNRQPHGTYSPAQQAARVAPAFLAPAAGWLVHRLLSWLQGALDRRSAGRVKVLEGKLRKQVAELKDSTRYERTLALLQKYDPDYAPPRPQGAPSGRQLGKLGAPGNSSVTSRAAGAAVNAAGTALQGAGAKMFPVLAQLYSHAAGTLIADDPVTLGLLREAQQESDALRHRLIQAEGRAVALLQDNIVLKLQLGLPVEAEQAALAAWTGAAPQPPAAGPTQQGLAELPVAAEEGSNGGVDDASQGAEPASPKEDGRQQQLEGSKEEEEEQEAAAPGDASPDAAALDATRAGTRRRRSGRA